MMILPEDTAGFLQKSAAPIDFKPREGAADITFGDEFSRELDNFKALNLSTSRMRQMTSAYDEEIERIKTTTGEVFANPYLHDPDQPGTERYGWKMWNYLDEFHKKSDSLRERFPEFQPKDKETIVNDRLTKVRKEIEERQRGIAPDYAWIASAGASVYGSLHDPLVVGGTVATLPFGGWGGVATAPGIQGIAAQIMRVALTEGVINAGIEASIQPSIATWRQELGMQYGIGDAVSNIASAGVAGGILGGAMKGVHLSYRSLVDAWVARRAAGAENSIVDAAASILDDAAQVMDGNPYSRGIESDALHRAAYEAAERAVIEGDLSDLLSATTAQRNAGLGDPLAEIIERERGKIPKTSPEPATPVNYDHIRREVGKYSENLSDRELIGLESLGEKYNIARSEIYKEYANLNRISSPELNAPGKKGVRIPGGNIIDSEARKFRKTLTPIEREIISQSSDIREISLPEMVHKYIEGSKERSKIKTQAIRYGSPINNIEAEYLLNSSFGVAEFQALRRLRDASRSVKTKFPPFSDQIIQPASADFDAAIRSLKAHFGEFTPPESSIKSPIQRKLPLGEEADAEISKLTGLSPEQVGALRGVLSDIEYNVESAGMFDDASLTLSARKALASLYEGREIKNPAQRLVNIGIDEGIALSLPEAATITRGVDAGLSESAAVRRFMEESGIIDPLDNIIPETPAVVDMSASDAALSRNVEQVLSRAEEAGESVPVYEARLDQSTGQIETVGVSARDYLRTATQEINRVQTIQECIFGGATE